MNIPNTVKAACHPPRRDGGQVLAIGALVILGLIAMAALVLEGGNAFAQQRATQNGADAAANAGAVVLAQRLGGVTKTDADVAGAISAIVASNGLTAYAGHYTNVAGKALDVDGHLTSSSGLAPAAVGAGVIPTCSKLNPDPTCVNAQGVAISASKAFETSIGHAINISSFTATADATAITGQAVGGVFLPVIFPVSISVCDQSGGTLPWVKDDWLISDPPATIGGYPNGTEYIVPLCKTNLQGNGGGSFQILDLDPSKTCLEETQNPPLVEWTTFPVDVPVDNGDNCAKPIAEEINANMRLQPVNIPFCDDLCVPGGSGSNAVYHVTGVAAFYVDWVYDTNGVNSPECQATTSPTSGQPLTNVIGGNGSSSCVHGWFIRLIRNGPVGSGDVKNAESIAVQLIR